MNVVQQPGTRERIDAMNVADVETFPLSEIVPLTALLVWWKTCRYPRQYQVHKLFDTYRVVRLK